MFWTEETKNSCPGNQSFFEECPTWMYSLKTGLFLEVGALQESNFCGVLQRRGFMQSNSSRLYPDTTLPCFLFSSFFRTNNSQDTRRIFTFSKSIYSHISAASTNRKKTPKVAEQIKGRRKTPYQTVAHLCLVRIAKPIFASPLELNSWGIPPVGHCFREEHHRT